MWISIAIIILAILSGYALYTYGKVKNAKDIAEEESKARAKNAEIASKPFVDRPLGRMRRK